MLGTKLQARYLFRGYDSMLLEALNEDCDFSPIAFADFSTTSPPEQKNFALQSPADLNNRRHRGRESERRDHRHGRELRLSRLIP
jgi:hypothetical protein